MQIYVIITNILSFIQLALATTIGDLQVASNNDKLLIHPIQGWISVLYGDSTMSVPKGA